MANELTTRTTGVELVPTVEAGTGVELAEVAKLVVGAGVKIQVLE